MPSPASLDVTSARPAADSQASDDLRTEVARLHTALADTRAQLARARRMESVGTLAASIADDLNNVLTPIVMASALLDQQLTDTESRRLLAVLDESAQRGAALVRQILSFTRDMQQAPLSSDPRQIFEDLRRVIAEGFPHSLQLGVEVASDVRGISIDAAGLLPVLMALCAAARDAMPGGGCLTLRAENMMVDDAQAAGFAGVRPGMFVVMSISASAGAMGASGVCSLEQYGGFVTLERRPNLGSVARIHVPAGAAQIDPDTADVDIDALRGRDELILLVDNEVSVRSIAARMLRAYGYRVLTAANGAEAVAECARRPGQIAAVMTDIMMPVMNGAHTVRALRTIDPQVVVLAVTGLDCGEAMFEGQDRVDAVLQKPLHAEAMLRALGTALSHKLP